MFNRYTNRKLPSVKPQEATLPSFVAPSLLQVQEAAASLRQEWVTRGAEDHILESLSIQRWISNILDSYSSSGVQWSIEDFIRDLTVPFVDTIAEATKNETLLSELSEYEDIHVRSIVAENVFTPCNVLRKLVLDVSEDDFEAQLIGVRLAQNPSTPPDVIDHLLNLNIGRILSAVSLRVSLSDEQLLSLSKHESYQIRYRLCSRSSLPEAVFLFLVSTADETMRTSLAGNSSAPLEWLIACAENDPSRSVRNKVYRNPVYTKYVLEKNSVLMATLRESLSQVPRHEEMLLLKNLLDEKTINSLILYSQQHSSLS